MSVHFVCPSIHTLECPFLRPSMRLSICPSVHPVHQSDLSFWPSVCLSLFASVLSGRLFVCQLFKPTIHHVVLLFICSSVSRSVRPSVQPFIYLQWLLRNKPHFQKFIITIVKVYACVQNPILNAYYANQTLGFDKNVDCLQVKHVNVSKKLDMSKLTYFSFSICKNGLTTRTLTTQKTVIGTTVP